MAPRRATTLIGLLISMAILLVLAVVGLNALSKSLGGSSTTRGTVASFKDQQYLTALVQAMAAGSLLDESRFLVPSELSRSGDVAENTTASLFSALIAKQYTVPGQLVSGNERNANVWPDDDYDFTAYDPRNGVFWDPRFVADLMVISNTSFAHLPLHGRRLRHWRFTASSRMPLLGNRGPADGIADPASYTYGIDGTWAGHVAYGDGHVELAESFTPPGLVYQSGGERVPDNLFAMEEGPDGFDAILAFTKLMSRDGPTLQYD